MIVSGQSGTLVGQGSACNRGCRHRPPSAYVLRKYFVCRCLLCAVNVTRLRFRDSSASSAAICSFRGYLLLRDVSLYLLDIKSVLTKKGLDIFGHKFHIPDDVHPQLPSPNQTIHEMPAGKIDVYTRFFEYANFRLPLSTFLVNVLRHYRINLSQLSVIAAAKVSHFEILCRVHNMDLFAFIQVADPTKVKVVERERVEGEAKIMDSTVGRVVPLLPVAPARAESELEASVDKLFNEGRNADQGDSAAGGGQDAETELVTGVKIIANENVIAERPKRPCKKRPAVTDASGSSHPPKKLIGDYETSSGAATSGKSPSFLKELLASSILNVEVGVAAVATVPLVTSSVAATPECKSGAPTNSITGLNLRTIGEYLKGSLSLQIC
ncbi:hypothetical protein Tco_0424123 [Tanacetum coccineum]